MSDHEDKLRDILELTDCGRGQWEPLLDALVAERDEAKAEAEAERCPIPPKDWEPAKAEWHQFHLDQIEAQRARAEAAEARATVLEAALGQIAEVQPEVLGYIEHHGFVFTDIGSDPGNWQHLAFSIYTDLCNADSIARAALAAPTKEDTDE